MTTDLEKVLGTTTTAVKGSVLRKLTYAELAELSDEQKAKIKAKIKTLAENEPNSKPVVFKCSRCGKYLVADASIEDGTGHTCDLRISGELPGHRYVQGKGETKPAEFSVKITDLWKYVDRHGKDKLRAFWKAYGGDMQSYGSAENITIRTWIWEGHSPRIWTDQSGLDWVTKNVKPVTKEALTKFIASLKK